MPPRRVHILVVEDDPDLRETLADALAVAGYDVSSACDGLEALARLNAAAPPDLILLDLEMPNMNGVEFRHAQLASEALASIPVAIVTADVEGPAKAKALGAPVLLKPLRLPQLLSAIPRVMRATRDGTAGTA